MLSKIDSILRRVIVACVCAAAGLLPPADARALEPGQVLLIHNSHDVDSIPIRKRYMELRPGVRALDLCDPTLAGRRTITYAMYRERIREPVRAHIGKLEAEGSGIFCLVLTRGIPHRIKDANRPEAGDHAAMMREEWLDRGDFTASSTDSELTLLRFDLEAGESGGSFDSALDGFVSNPWFAVPGRFTDHGRRARGARSMPSLGAAWMGEADDGSRDGPLRGGWSPAEGGPTEPALSPGDIFLVTRLDGRNVGDVIEAMKRARDPKIRPSEAAFVLDAGEGGTDGGDYRRAAERFTESGWLVVHDETRAVITAADCARPLLLFASHGPRVQNGGRPAGAGYLGSFVWHRGAIFNTLESFNGRDIERRSGGEAQIQIADFLAAGGTAGIANAWEPFAFSAARNDLLLEGMIERGLTFAEAAWRALPVLSWQQIVIGDPLMRWTVESD